MKAYISIFMNISDHVIITYNHELSYVLSICICTIYQYLALHLPSYNYVHEKSSFFHDVQQALIYTLSYTVPTIVFMYSNGKISPSRRWGTASKSTGEENGVEWSNVQWNPLYKPSLHGKRRVRVLWRVMWINVIRPNK